MVSTYKEHGSSVFETLNKNHSYIKDFKLSVIEEYVSGRNSLADLAAKDYIASEVVRRWVNKWYNGIEIKDMILKEMSIP